MIELNELKSILDYCPDTGIFRWKNTHGYVEFMEWAEKKSKTHRQVRCPVCKKWAIWKRKKLPEE